MRYALCLLVGLTGCGADPLTDAAIAIGTTAGSVAVMQRTPLDALYSLATGRDCSVVWLDRGQSYCRPTEPPPDPQPYCTHSLGIADCWFDPRGEPRPVGDGPASLTPAQEANRTRRWPW